jgi:N-acetylmuramoyl-L-alanine amidase
MGYESCETGFSSVSYAPYNKEMKLIKFAYFTFLLCLAAAHLHSQPASQPLSVRYQTSPGDTTFLSCFGRSDLIYLPLQSLLKPLQIPAVVNDTLHKIEFLAGKYLLRITHKSSFIVVTDRLSDASSIIQMPAEAAVQNEIFYVPLQYFLPLFSRLSGKQLEYDNEARSLTLKTPRDTFDITGMTIEKRINGYLLNIHAARKLGDVESWLKPDGWLFITITNATADTLAIQKTEPVGAIKKILVFQSPTSVQLTFRVGPEIEQAEVINDPATDNLLVSLRTKDSKQAEAKRKQIVQSNKAKERSRWKLDVIVIDAGHGGKDPGTIGVRHTREKNITLPVALKLGKLIENSLKDVKVVYTRKTDTFIELYRRTQIANEAGGKLFISIHCNSVERKPSPMNGFEIYLLRPGRTQEAVEIASKENAVIQFEEGYEERYKKLTEEEFIIVTMAQSAYMKQSEQFAEVAARTMSGTLKIKNSGVKQAGFYVLVGASMPNVLVELGYLSNKKEEQLLKSNSGQSKIADALLQSIKKYKLQYEKALQEGNKDE